MVGFIVQYQDDNGQWVEYDRYYDRKEATRIASFLSKANIVRIITGEYP